MSQNLAKLLIIAGPTASGKTAISVEVAKKIHGEIIVADSMQVYRKLNIGTAKPSLEEMAGIPHHLIDIICSDETFSAGAFAKEASKVIEAATARGNVPIISGGTGLYIKALIHGLAQGLPSDTAIKEDIKSRLVTDGLPKLYHELKSVDPKTAARLSPQDKQRVTRALEVYYAAGTPISELQKKHKFKAEKYNYLFFALRRDRKELIERIEKRVDEMFEKGLVDETRMLINRFKNKFEEKDISALRAIGYRETVLYLDGKLNLEETKALVKKSTRDYAKRQMTWLRHQHNVNWVDITENSEPQAEDFITSKALNFFT
ncbi:MAG: tRNA (adenosine(37)-N6)-dimethylallyltransferase MiaA [Candidatus Schekmanbacteria bacterium]|nr:tRNA (adenosine(37)-N6)-dimethylallyltransferase MiaA [Candidatus Schekmanbacteria bacterium]